MDFSLTTEQKLLLNSVHEYCVKNIEPIWVKIDEEARIPPNIIKDLARLGVYGGVLSGEYGGSDMSFLDVALVAEEVSSHEPSLSLGSIVSSWSNCWPFIVQLYGSDEAKGEFLPKITSGEATIGIASTEAQGGSDVAGIYRVQARKINDDKWIISGEKSIVSGGAIMDSMPWGGGWFLIARTAPIETRHKGLTNFILYRKKNGQIVEGISYSRYKHMGRHALESEILTINVEVDDRYRVGGVNEGFRIALEGFNLGRTFIGGSILGGVKWLINQGLEWIKSRQLFGKPLSSYQGISFELAKIYEEAEAARLLVYKAAWLADRYYRYKDPTIKPIDIGIAGAAAKTRATEVALKAAQEIMQWFGGMAYFTEMPIFRNLLAIYAFLQGAEGAPKTLRDLIARSIVEGRVRME